MKKKIKKFPCKDCGKFVKNLKDGRCDECIKIAYTLPSSYPTNLHIQGIDRDGRQVDFEVSLVEGTITENGHCRFI